MKKRFSRKRTPFVCGCSTLVFVFLAAALVLLYPRVVGLVKTYLPAVPVIQKDIPTIPLQSIPTRPPTPTPTPSPETIFTETFTAQTGNWYEEIWYKPADALGEVVFGDKGVTFIGIERNSRSGIMVDLNADVSDYSRIMIHAVVQADMQTLSGTGFNGREAPVAIAVAYIDINDLVHTGLSEDPTYTQQMFWRGFYYMDPILHNSGQAVNINGVKVVQHEPYTYEFDLVTLDPKPKTILFIALEGAGWRERQGSVLEFTITGYR